MTVGRSAGWTNGPIPIIEPEFVASVLSATSDMAFVLSADGVIKSVLIDQISSHQKRIEPWVGRPMHDVLTTESRPKLDDALQNIHETIKTNRKVELNHQDGKGWELAVKYSFHKVGPGDSILMLGEDLSIVAETQEQLVQAQIALERGYEERRENDARYRVLMATTRDAFVFVNSDGRIKDINPAAASLLGSDVERLTGAPLVKEFANRRRVEFVETLQKVASSDFENEVTVKTANGGHELRITPHMFRAAGERLMVCRLAPANQPSAVESALQNDLDALFHKSTDAFVICDAAGVITEANEAFLELADVGTVADVRSRSLAEFLQRGQIDLGVMLDNTRANGHMRIYSTRLNNNQGAQSAVEISSVQLSGQDKPGVAFVLRDADRATAIRPATQPTSSTLASNQNVVELVGSATLKEIVAETNDLIEQMCIETAVELTRNNRAAAAEMLGVSRQSLYVKLRKYGLLKRDES